MRRIWPPEKRVSPFSRCMRCMYAFLREIEVYDGFSEETWKLVDRMDLG